MWITGSSQGLGKALAELFLKEGHQVIGLSRSCRIEHANYRHIALDLSSLDALKSIEFDMEDDFEAFILINNAASVEPIKHFENIDAEEITENFQLNTIAPAVLANSFIKSPCNEKSKKYVLNIGTGAASNPMDGWSLYCSSKAAINMLSAVYQKEKDLNGNKTKMVTLAPGIIDTPMQEKIRSSSEKNFSNVARFTFYHKNKQLSSPISAAKKIIANFERIFDKDLPNQSIRDY